MKSEGENKKREKKSQEDIIKTISYDQEEIIKWIMELYCPNGFDLDPTYSKGNFYKNLREPRLKSDIEPQSNEVKKSDCRNLDWIKSDSLDSIIFDPPFVASIPKKNVGGIIAKRFGYYRNVQNELWGMYHKSLKEFYRILKDNGFLIFKCQDTIDSGNQYFSHVEIINYAIQIGFYPRDLFVLLAKNRIIGKHHHKQRHARKYHSYFIVFEKRESKVKYFKVIK